MQYRYFECSCGTKFNEFTQGEDRLEGSTVKTDFFADCPTCGVKVSSSWNDPKAVGTKLLFNYMER